MQQLDFLLILSASKSENKVSIFDEIRKKFIIHTRGMGSPTCRSVLLQEKILNRSLMWKKFLKSMV
jgi:hypothetical protein